jgi:DnaJ-class molecular chaperone
VAIPNDPKTRRPAASRTVALQAPDLCLWCLGSGSYLEEMDGGRRFEYIPVVCPRCEGAGRAPR